MVSTTLTDVCTPARLRAGLDWRVVLLPVIAVAFVPGYVRFLLTGDPPIATDPAFFQHTGWYVLQGAVPYVDVWDVNPPVPFGITALLAVFAGGDMGTLHALGVTLTVAVSAASVLLVGSIARRVTESDAAAVAAGLTMLVLPELYVLALQGTRAQVLALFFGSLALWLALDDRPFLAGTMAALSAGAWQSGLVFAPLVVGVAYQRRGRGDALRSIAGGGVVAGAVVVVFAAAGALVPMVVQTVVAPMVAGSPYTLAERVYTLLLVFGYSSLLIPVAGYGWWRALRADWRARWWIPAGGVILALQVLFVDLDGSTDAFCWLVFLALGVALVVERIAGLEPTTDRRDAGRERAVEGSPGSAQAGANPGPNPTATGRRRWAVIVLVLAVGVFAVAGPVWNSGSPYPSEQLQTLQQEAEPDAEPLPITPDDGDVPSMQTIYWDQIEPETCHYRLSWNEVRWVAMTEDRLDATHCGGWPDRVDQ